ncbi:Hypothetical_protein [Hexamita inflata]|uniref:Hypothetical_protein n=1 Tax=Hexamita inflata TaxID=28002 RepID=A0AA86QVM8_9EUKA|nr:Hypothetical protein HINF_LOCUS10549 [Hexamita inflata]CAI9936046.1 Hypothetical protein HINF_LOCUS23691 [Hexamita inflata]CAI9961637.1 Hypothetical protein HINF_LOCUS49282 [Hexamita inflata]
MIVNSSNSRTAIIQASPQQLAKLYKPSIIDHISKLTVKLQDIQAKYIGEDPHPRLFVDFEQHDHVKAMSPEERACLYAVAFGVSVKTAVELAIPDPPDRSRQMVYKLVRDKKELLGVRRSKETFLNGEQLHECCITMMKQKISGEGIWKFLEEKADQLFGPSNWDRGVLNQNYIDMVQKKLKFMTTNGTSAVNQINQVNFQQSRMAEVTARLQMQQKLLAKVYVDQQPVAMQDFACGSYVWNEESSD